MPPLKELLAALRGELKLTVRSGVLGLSGKDGLDRYPFNRADAALTCPRRPSRRGGLRGQCRPGPQGWTATPAVLGRRPGPGPVLLPKDRRRAAQGRDPAAGLDQRPGQGAETIQARVDFPGRSGHRGRDPGPASWPCRAWASEPMPESRGQNLQRRFQLQRHRWNSSRPT
jgi:hypothetical protein